MVVEVENKKEDTGEKRARFQIILISTGLSFLIIGVVILLSTVLMDTDSLEYFIATLISGILFGFALFFEGHGYFLLLNEYGGGPNYFGSPVLFQVIRVIYRVPYVLLCYNGLIIVGGINLELVVLLAIFFSPYIISRATWRWTRLRKWLKSLDTV